MVLCDVRLWSLYEKIRDLLANLMLGFCRWRSSLLWRAFFTTALVSVVLQTGISYCGDDNCGLFGSGGLIIYNIGDVSVDFGLAELLPVVILGVIGGVLGCLFTFINGKILKFYFALHNK